MNNYVNLMDLVTLYDDEKMSEGYVKYLNGFSKDRVYRHYEIISIHNLIHMLKLEHKYFNNFLYSYSLPQLSKEFDLLCITDKYVLNIELKSINTGDRIEKQLCQNAYYLKMLNKNILEFCYIEEEKRLLKYTDNKVVDCTFNELQMFLNYNPNHIQVNLDEVFDVGEVLISPLKDPMRFIENNYILTENQDSIKRKILEKLEANKKHYLAITGNAGTGKTLLVYDLAKELAKKDKVLVINSGKLSNGHLALESMISNLTISSQRETEFEEIEASKYVLIDEAHRLAKDDFIKLTNKIEYAKATCIFSYDERQASKSEEAKEVLTDIKELCKDQIYKLTGRIRANKEMSAFINNLMDLSKHSKEKYTYDNVKIIYEPNTKAANMRTKILEEAGYKYITYRYMVYDQEFDNVVMIMGDEFYYENGKLKCIDNKNSDYSYTALLYQGLNRVRKNLALIITNKELIPSVLNIYKKR